jgi:hypothetical protein
MPYVRSLREVTVRTTSGHTVHVPASQVTFMPPLALPDAIALGCVECDQSGNLNLETRRAQVASIPVVEVPKLEEDERDDMDARANAILQAVAALYQENDQSKFGKITNLPKVMYVVELTGFPTSLEEIRTAVESYHAKTG